MKKRLKFLITYYISWVIFFILNKIGFLVFHLEKSSEFPYSEWAQIIWHGLRLDLSTAGYLTAIPALLLVITTFIRGGSFVSILINSYSVLLLVVISALVAADMGLYQYWGFRLDSTPLLYLNTPEAALSSVKSSLLIKLVIIFLASCLVSLTVYFEFIGSIMADFKKRRFGVAFVLLILAGSLIFPIRGGFSVAPINTGSAYYSNNIFCNHAAINVIYNIGYSLKNLKASSFQNDYFDKDKTEAYFNELYIENDTLSEKILRTERPNILLIGLESFNAKAIASLGGMDDITPNFDSLSKEGILFQNFYASGDRTDKGLISILNGYPAQTTSSIIKFPNKAQQLPYLNKSFKDLGYFTSFSFGHNPHFANFNSYLSNSAYDQLTTLDDFEEDFPQNKWGIHDEFVFDRVLSELGEASEPFFKTTFTLSSHEPFDVPMETVIEGEDEESMFLNAMYYTDKCLGDFISKAKKQRWWANTLVILVADHSNRHPNNTKVHEPEKFHIPMLWLGGALSVQDTVINTYASQTDISKTLLRQLGEEAEGYIFSKDIFRKGVPSFAFYVFNDGFGFLTDSTTVVYDNIGRSYIVQKGVTRDKDFEYGKAYLQKLFWDINEK